MDQSNDNLPARGTLALVNSPLRLAHEGEGLPSSWSAALADLSAWLGIETAVVPSPDAQAPDFAPWTAWSASALQNGGPLPEAQFVASYCIDRAVDIMLVSALPVAEQGVFASTGTLRAMIRAAVAEGRERIAIIGHARQYAALAAMRLGEDPVLCPAGVTLDVLTIEDAIPQLMTPGGGWDAIIAGHELRSIVFTLIAETSGVAGPWPMLWHCRGVRRVTCEVKGEGRLRLPLDAPVLIHTLALTLHASGKARAALRLHGAWAALRERGVTTPARGSDAPYATEVTDSDFIALLCSDAAPARAPGIAWRALENLPRLISGSQMPTLRVVSANFAKY